MTEPRKAELSLIERSTDLAQSRHAGQFYDKAGAIPYYVHLVETMKVLTEYGYTDERLLAAAVLHDTLEDTDTTMAELVALDEDVATMVWSCTAIEGNRRQRLKTLVSRLVINPRAIPVKLADRIANVTNCWLTLNTMLFTYRREYEILRTLRRDDADHRELLMWKRLDTLLGWVEYPKKQVPSGDPW